MSETGNFSTEPPEKPRSLWWFWSLLILVFAVAGSSLVTTDRLLNSRWGTEIWLFSVSAIEILPFLPVIVLAQLGLKSSTARSWALAYWFILVAGIVLVVIGAITHSLMDPRIREKINDQELTAQQLLDAFEPGSASKILWAIGLMLLVSGAGLFVFSPSGRRVAMRLAPLKENSFTQIMAFSLTVVLLGACFLPLIILRKPPPLAVDTLADNQGVKEIVQTGLLQRLLYYRLIWAIPTALMAAGFPITRSFFDALDRLGIGRLSLKQIGAAFLVAVGLFCAQFALSYLVNWLWGLFGWPTTDETKFDDLFKAFKNYSGAIAIGLVAGISEELAFRGLLQPRLGLVLSNTLFAAVHAWQYHWDGVVIVFMIGLICGLVRKYVNTTAAIFVHGSYDTLVVLLMVMKQQS